MQGNSQSERLECRPKSVSQLIRERKNQVYKCRDPCKQQYWTNSLHASKKSHSFWVALYIFALSVCLYQKTAQTIALHF